MAGEGAEKSNGRSAGKALPPKTPNFHSTLPTTLHSHFLNFPLSLLCSRPPGSQFLGATFWINWEVLCFKFFRFWGSHEYFYSEEPQNLYSFEALIGRPPNTPLDALVWWSGQCSAFVGKAKWGQSYATDIFVLNAVGVAPCTLHLRTTTFNQTLNFLRTR